MATKHKQHETSESNVPAHAPASRNGTRGVAKGERNKHPNLAWMVRGISDDGREMIDTLFGIMRGVSPVEDAVTTNHVIAAANALLDRGFGKAPLTIVHEDSSTEELAAYSLEQLAQMLHAVETGQAAIAIEPADEPTP